ncbi:ferritin-like domain-containing protein [Stakelama saccharophila]|uniref:Ferritin-like domain-containing protein n=1 Tax=Stakelama saccharophila TaxID=3075605 RepID=A0ABZ0B5N8_9SPHN|nr:ferritin-like domain-containing protein [Stakelama sp. W311]WNO52693.1 ferritin-like domain-containing protein [Stakelama sp. W311]
MHALENQALALMNRQVEHLEHYPEVEARLRSHIDETHGQIARVEEILESLDEKNSAVKDAGMTMSGNLAALAHTAAGDEIVKNSFANYAFENYEAASYTGLITMAEEGGFAQAVTGLKQSLDEEQAMAQFIIDGLPMVTRQFLQRRAAGETASH